LGGGGGGSTPNSPTMCVRHLHTIRKNAVNHLNEIPSPKQRANDQHFEFISPNQFVCKQYVVNNMYVQIKIRQMYLEQL